MVFRAWSEKLLQSLSGAGVARGPARVSGRPPSGNGASSFHLTWDVPPVGLSEVSVTFELVEPPTVEMLYFWAVQVNFSSGGIRRGGAHFGLQYNPLFPDSNAVNWGGYHDGGGELEGSVSTLPSTPDHINTRDYRWEANRRYRYHVGRSPDGWQGSITDLETGVETVVRDLWVDADTLEGPMVWSEVFAHCDHPPVGVRWTDLRAVTADGQAVDVDSVRLNYQTYGNGGCANTNTSVEGRAFVQRTNTERINPTGTRLTLNPGR